MFFKRRSRANSYIDNDAPVRSQSYDEYEKRPDSSSRANTQQPVTSPTEEKTDMYPRQQAPQEAFNRGPVQNGGHNSMPSMGANVPAPLNTNSGMKAEPMPDLLAQAFNQAIRPYTEKIEHLESQLAEMQNWVEQLEQQRAEVHSWIDKRGLRPDVPPSIAKIMDTTTPDAAVTLNAQLDRKITIVNFDLHRLQDDLNDSISSAHFASAMLKFLPDINRLSLLPTGPRHAFDLVLKLGGNLNSHGGLDSSDEDDIIARRDFYSKLDDAMVEVVSRRFNEGEEWNVSREIKRIEKTATYLRTFGVEPYFPQTLDLMRREMDFQQRAGGAPQQQQQQQIPNGQGTPPRYH
ncbi:hypothetical protein BU24DRAFT_118014 [Aaosphaeria arxii CBS 175.79]|uniref:Uncharacterized protein n=1 Tax=Aaosphaeria arxii CBS 175.79 TaxID=1450172 RepID=A0A6A5Y1J1_9PLEO|nr:uncharacterized protein BU24DRAFT_118014 [Aaosphaeria arxii CBS 175.79]KAF2019348.1 hypothetical protein BU24DRAFT_118014 [Aaosphaeria arxii CBS 175.79]